MSSAGQIVGGVVGAVIGYIAGGPYGAMQGAMIGAGVGTYVDPPKGPKLQGPRLNDLSIQTSTYGASIGRVEGTCAISGNVIWVEGDRLKESSKENDSGGKGGGSATTETFTYSASFAVGLCKGPIAGVRRIWVGSDLIYDAGADDFASVVESNKVAAGFRIHLGTEDQMPDPRIQADKGIDNTPAYRGLAYIVFDDFDLSNYGNTLMAAQVKVEVVNSDTETSGWVESPSVTSFKTNPTGAHFYTTGSLNDSIVYFDDIERTLNVSVGLNGWKSIKPSVTFPSSWLGIRSYFQWKGALYLIYQAGVELIIYKTTDLFEWYIVYTETLASSYLAVLRDISSDSESLVCARLVGYVSGVGTKYRVARFYVEKAEKGLNPWVNYSEMPDSQFIWAYCYFEGVNYVVFNVLGDALYLAKVKPDYSGYDFIAESRTESGGEAHLKVIGRKIWWSGGWWQNSKCVVYDVDSQTISRYSLPSYSSENFQQFNLLSIYGVPVQVYYNTIIEIKGAVRALFFKDGVSPSGVQLSTIVKKLALGSGLIADADIDTTALTQMVRGYRTTGSGSISSDIEPLRAAWPFDVIQRGYGIVAKPRGGSSVITIQAEMLDAREGSGQRGPQISRSVEMASQMPRRLTLKYLDADREYDASEQSAERENTESINDKSTDLPVVMTATEAVQKAEILLYMYWLERVDVQITLPPIYLAVEAGDVITVEAASAVYELRVVEATYTPDCRVECKCKYNSASVYVSTATADGGTVQGRPLALTGPSTVTLLDVPCVNESTMDKPAMLAAMTGYTSAWPGGVLYKSTDEGQTWSDIAFWNAGCTTGFARNAIAAQQTAIIDAASVLQVDMVSGTLESVTELAMMNGANHFAYGADGRWEIIAAKNAILQTDGSYLLSDLLRGRAGTEWATSLHAAGDTVILLTDPDIKLIGMDSVAIGAARQYKAITIRHDLSEDAGTTKTYRGVNLKPLSPVYANGQRVAATGDWSLSWIRRTRIGGEWRDSVDALLGEAVEKYEVEIYSSSAFTTVKRTITVSSADPGWLGPSVPYLGTSQVADFGSTQTTLYLRIYQISATVGRGYPLQATLTRTA